MAFARLQVADRFPAGTKIEVFPMALIGEPARDGRAPIGLEPVTTGKIDRDGVLEVEGLPRGQYTACGDVDGSRRYVGFSAK